MLSASALSQTDFFGFHHVHFPLVRSRAPTRDAVIQSNQQRGKRHELNYKLVFGVVVGAALGAAAIQGLHAQAKPKAYTVSELETLDAAANAAFVPLSRLRNRRPVVAICALAVERLLLWRGRRRNVSPSPSGIAWSRRRPFTNRKPGMTSRRSVTRPSRQFGDTLSKR